MGGHVTYACNCLNVKIHLANKYYLEGHEKFRRDKFTRLEEPPIEGWKFELSMDGVVVEYASLIRLRIIMDNPEGWVTVSCHNCSTGDVYSVKRPHTKIVYPFNNSLLSQLGDQVIIHKGAIFGAEIDKLKKKATYSTPFHIILNPDLPITHVSQEDEDDIYGLELKKQHKHVQQLLRQSLIDLEEITEKRIQEFQREQEILLVREKEKATYDSAILWQRMKEIARTVQEEEQRVRRLALQKTKNGVTDQILFNRIMSEEEQDQTVRDTILDATEIEMKRRESHVHFAQSDSYEPAEQRRRSSAFKRDLFGGFGAPIHHSRRRSSYVLDESAIANSFKNTHPLESVPEMPHHNQLHPLAEANHHVHPLAPPAAVVPSNGSSSWEDDEENAVKVDSDSSEEELFPLDEDMEDPDEHSPFQGRKLSSKRRPSSKYIEFEEEQEEQDKGIHGQQSKSSKYNANTSSGPHEEQQDHSFATSVPITIHHPPAFPVKNKTEDMQTSVQKKHPSSSFIQQPTYLNPALTTTTTTTTTTGRKPSFVGFDYAEADRRASLKFPPLELKRNSIHHAMSTTSHPKEDHHTQQHHLSSNKNKIELELEEEDDTEHDQDGPMIPPHILAAHTVADETEALFGSVPRNSTRHRPLE